jgi:hypothetical protein
LSGFNETLILLTYFQNILKYPFLGQFTEPHDINSTIIICRLRK